METMSAIFSTYLLVFAAEFGDKSQLVCLALATRYGARSVLIGAILAFAALTGLAVLLGSTLGAWISEAPLHFAAALLFVMFAVQMLRVPNDEISDEPTKTWPHSVIFQTFMLISFSEMADKTQILVVSLSPVEPLMQTFFGATFALASTSALGVWAGSYLLKPQNLNLIHRLSALLFFAFALVATYRGVTAL